MLSLCLSPRPCTQQLFYNTLESTCALLNTTAFRIWQHIMKTLQIMTNCRQQQHLKHYTAALEQKYPQIIKNYMVRADTEFIELNFSIYNRDHIYILFC